MVIQVLAEVLSVSDITIRALTDTALLLCRAPMALPAAAYYTFVLIVASLKWTASGQYVSLNGANLTSLYHSDLTVNFTSGHVNKLGSKNTIGPIYDEIFNIYTKVAIFQADGSNTSPNGGLGSTCFIINVIKSFDAILAVACFENPNTYDQKFNDFTTYCAGAICDKHSKAAPAHILPFPIDAAA